MKYQIAPKSLALACIGGYIAASAPAFGDSTTPGSNGFIQEVVVHSHPLSAEGLSQAHQILTDAELSKHLAGSIGETLGQLPGIRNSSFGKAVGQPIIRGLSGPRVKVLEDRIDTMDVSVTSTDHAVTVEPFIANQIEVLKGSGTLLYGSGAIGGVVDVHTGRIPHTVPDELTGRIEVRYDDASNQKTGAGRIDGGTGNFAWHADLFGRDADDYEIPGFAESKALRALEAEENEHGHGDEDDHDEDHGDEHDEDEARGLVPGSHHRGHGGAFGLSWVGERGFVGASVSRMEAFYGLPGGHGHGHDHEHESESEHDEDHVEDEGTPVLDMQQTRVDIEAGVSDPLPGFSSLNLRIGHNNYDHQEIEADGAVASRFDNEATDSRLELSHHPLLGWNGAIGIQYTDRTFSTLGEEAFVPPVDTRSTGVFWVAERSFDNFSVEAGVRAEKVHHDPAGNIKRDFTVESASLGAIIPLSDIWQLNLTADYSSRAPTGEELYSDGPHLATGTFEKGDINLDEEQATGFSATVSGNGDQWHLEASLYSTRFHDYIYQRATGDEEDELPVLQFDQSDARYSGIDAMVSLQLHESENSALSARLTYDKVTAKLNQSAGTESRHLPRIPPSAFGVGFDYDMDVDGDFIDNLKLSVDFRHVSAQKDVADMELPTESYRDLRVYLTATKDDLEWFLHGLNLTDDEQRNHSSFIKDLVPQPGRSVETGFRYRF